MIHYRGSKGSKTKRSAATDLKKWSIYRIVEADIISRVGEVVFRDNFHDDDEGVVSSLNSRWSRRVNDLGGYLFEEIPKDEEIVLTASY